MAPTARRALQHLPEKVALAPPEFITGPLLENPQRVGKPLHGKYAGRFSARRGELRIIYAVNETARAVEVSDVDYRRDVYH
jgi:mRNA interferase RelE/StbE